MRVHDPIAIARNLAAFDFQELAPFNAGAFCMFYGDQGDQSDWELHPDTDELLMVLEGSVTVEILTATDRHRLPLTAGQFAVVPKGHWHRHTDAHDVVEMFYTPGTTLESSADDPRVASPETRLPRLRGATGRADSARVSPKSLPA
jgi:mannose-6-phosphate isomerase-like protein (cupin superfamily)